MNELIASEVLEEFLGSLRAFREAALSMMAFSLAVRKGLSLEFAEI